MCLYTQTQGWAGLGHGPGQADCSGRFGSQRGRLAAPDCEFRVQCSRKYAT